MNRDRKIVRSRSRNAAIAAVLILLPCSAGAQLQQKAFPEPVLDSLRTALAAYEDVRGQLAADKLEGLSASAARLADALRSALAGRSQLPEEIPGVIEEAIRNAEALAEVKDLAAARAEFGEVSRRILLLAAADPRLAQGRYVFACPMVKTFPKWIQTSEDLRNPYMGKAMLACGFSTDWSAPASSSSEEKPRSSRGEAAESQAHVDSGSGPEFTPGIPGVKMADVRDHKFLWREIEELQRWERADRISIAEYRSKVIEKTAHFLGFGGVEADNFAGVADQAVTGVRDSFREMRRSGRNPGASGTRFSSDLLAGVNHVAALLGDEPRHQLFAPDCKKWLLKLAFGPSEKKEAKQTRAGS